MAAISSAIFALYFLWGTLVDAEIFWKIIRDQASQLASFSSAYVFLTDARLATLALSLGLGWGLWLWISVAYSAKDEELPAGS